MSGRKWKSCESHILNLINKQATVYDIAAFAFIDSPKDGPLYDERRLLMQKGFGNITSLMTQCEKDWEDGQRRVQEVSEAVFQIVQRGFTEIWYRGNERYREVKKDLGDLWSRLERLVQDKEFQLSPQDLAICESVKAGSVFRMLLGDCTLAVTEALISNLSVLSWDISRESQMDWAAKLRKFAEKQAMDMRADVAKEAGDLASLLGAERFINEFPQFTDSEVQAKFQFFFPSTARPEAENCLKAGEAENEAGHFAEAGFALQRGRDLMCGATGSELYLQLSRSLAESYILMGRLKDARSLCQDTLEFWNEKTKYGLEFVRILLCSNVATSLGFSSSVTARKWQENLSADISRSQILYFTCRNPTVELIEKELLLGQSFFMNILYSFTLPILYAREATLQEAENALASAIMRFPGASVFEISCLMAFHDLYYQMGHRGKSEYKLGAAKQLSEKYGFTEVLNGIQNRVRK